MEKHSFLFISPHLDDAVFSCGGYIGKLRALGFPVSVLTLFSGSPTDKLSLLARALHVDWNLPRDAAAIRREEDRQALAMLGAEAVHAGFLDCIYRRDRMSGKPVYTRLGQILGQETVEETQLVEEIAQYLEKILQEGAYQHTLAPLELGGHVDHLITHAAARMAQSRYPQTRFYSYEDLPYAIKDAPKGNRVRGMCHFYCTRKDGSAQKYAAMEQYVSQVKSPRYSGGIDIEAIMRYGMDFEKVSGSLAERVWFSKY
jgi:LmbE family N-acetylglucosaminyl deacetylase